MKLFYPHTQFNPLPLFPGFTLTLNLTTPLPPSPGYSYDPDCMYINGSGRDYYEFYIQLNRCGTLGRNSQHEASRKHPTVCTRSRKSEAPLVRWVADIVLMIDAFAAAVSDHDCASSNPSDEDGFDFPTFRC